MGPPEFGLYLTLYDEDRPGDRDRSPLGPFDELTVRSARVVGERGRSGRLIAAHSPNGGWLGVDAELQHSFASGPAGARLGLIRVRAQEARVCLRLFDDAPERSAPVPELGPFDAVVIGSNDIAADGRTIAVRVSPTASWLLTDLAGADLQGTAKAVVAFRAAASATGPTPRWSDVPGSREERSLEPTALHSSGKPDPLPVLSSGPPPSVWVDRVRSRSEIYVSRPGVQKKP